MNDIFSHIKDDNKRSYYLEMISNLKDKKVNDIDAFDYKDLPITYFLSHTFNDFVNEKVNAKVKRNVIDCRGNHW